MWNTWTTIVLEAATSIKMNDVPVRSGAFKNCPNIKYVFVKEFSSAERYFKEEYKNENGNQNSNVKLIYDLDEFNKLVYDLKKNTPVTKPIVPDNEKHETQSEIQNENEDKEKNHDDKDKIISYSKAFDLKFFLALPTVILAAIFLIYNLFKIKSHNKNKRPLSKILKNHNRTNQQENKNDRQTK